MARTTTIGLFSLLDHVDDPLTGRQASVAERLRQVVEQGVVAEQVGFERFGVGEHHFTGYVLSNPALILAAVAARTTRIRLFTAVTLLACGDPVRIAEDIGIVDCLSGGRLELSFGRGVSWEAARVFGVDQSNVYSIMAGKLTALIDLLSTGKLLVPGAEPSQVLSLVPRAVQRPTPPLWIGGGVHVESCDLAIERGLPLFLPSLFRHPEDYLPLVERYRAGMTAAGHADRIRVAMPTYCWVDRDGERARRTFRPRLEAYVNFARGLRDGHGRPLDFDSLLEGPVVCGSPAEVTDRIAAINEKMGLDVHILMMDLGGVPPDELHATMELLGHAVLPQFGQRPF